MNNSERIEVPVVDPSGCPRPRRRGQRRDFLANCASGLAPSTATTNRGGAPEAGDRAKKERAAKRMPTFRNPETLYQLQVAIRLRQHWKIKHQGRPALTARPLISVNRGLKAGQPLIDGLPATKLKDFSPRSAGYQSLRPRKAGELPGASEQSPRKGDTLCQLSGRPVDGIEAGGRIRLDPFFG